MGALVVVCTSGTRRPTAARPALRCPFSRQETGRDPVTDEPLTEDDLLPLKVGKVGTLEEGLGWWGTAVRSVGA